MANMICPSIGKCALRFIFSYVSSTHSFSDRVWMIWNHGIRLVLMKNALSENRRHFLGAEKFSRWENTTAHDNIIYVCIFSSIVNWFDTHTIQWYNKNFASEHWPSFIYIHYLHVYIVRGESDGVARFPIRFADKSSDIMRYKNVSATRRREIKSNRNVYTMREQRAHTNTQMSAM